MREDYQNVLKKPSLFFLLNLVPFNARIHQKQKGPRTSDQLLFMLLNKVRKIPLLVTYYLTFRVIPKITSANLCQSIHDIINYSTSIFPFVSGKCVKEGKKLQKFEYLENKRAF